MPRKRTRSAGLTRSTGLAHARLFSTDDAFSMKQSLLKKEKPSAPISSLPKTGRHFPATDHPVGKAPPESDPLREVVESVQADCRLAPDEYLEEVRVPVGGE